MWSITKKEIVQFFGSLTGFLAIVLFLLINGLFLFVFTDSSILDFGYATLDAFFNLAPWVFAFMVPAISMRSFSEEYKAGTFELLKTMPLNSWQLVLGKYLAILLIMLIILLPTLIYVYTIRALSATGETDGGAIAGSYAGLLLLAAVFAAIGIWCSSFTSNALVAFLISVFACITLYFGFTALSKLPVFTGGADYFIDMLGIDGHYRSMSRGVLSIRDVVYFLSVTTFFLYLTVLNIRKR